MLPFLLNPPCLPLKAISELMKGDVSITDMVLNHSCVCNFPSASMSHSLLLLWRISSCVSINVFKSKRVIKWWNCGPHPFPSSGQLTAADLHVGGVFFSLCDVGVDLHFVIVRFHHLSTNSFLLSFARKKKQSCNVLDTRQVNLRGRQHFM